LRVHRSWLVNVEHVRELEGYGSETELLVGSPGADPQGGVRIPVSRDRAQTVRETLLSSTMGVRMR
jgi:two-component system, LytTR family, response regulator LytT